MKILRQNTQIYLRVLLLVAIQSITVNLLAQQWYLSPVYHGRSMHTAEILTRSKIIVGGGNEQNDSLQDIFRSASGGLDWSFSSNQGGGYIRDMAFTDSLNGIAVGYAGKILKTTDGANSWTRIYPPGAMNQRNFNKVLFLDNQTLLAFGGRNYSNDSMQTVIKSVDGGNSWSILHDVTGPWLKSACFIDAQNGFAVGENGTILRTTNGGTSWSSVISSASGRALNAIAFANANTGFIVGGIRYDTPDSTRTILKTINGGNTWSTLIDEPGPWLTDISFLDQNNGYIVGDSATFIKTVNGGTNWIYQNVNGAQFYSSFNSVNFLNSDYGVITGMYGEVYLYSNETLPVVQTVNPSVIQVTDTTATVVIRANINTHGTPVRYNYIYSTTEDFSSDVGYAFSPIFPATFNSNQLTHTETTLNNLLPNTTYYYYVFATAINGVVYGDTLSFTTTIPYSQLITSNATLTVGSSAVLNGSVSGATQPVNLFFEYGTTTQLGTVVTATPVSVNTTATTNISATVSGLQENVIYYYRIKAVSQSQEYYGNIVSFYSGSLFTSFETDSATNVTSTSARINGFVDGFNIPVNVYFSFGNTLSMGNNVGATPSAITDNGPHQVYADVNSLQPNTFYYYRLIGQSQVGIQYSTHQSFFTGTLYNTFQATPATSVLENSAIANATVDGLLFPTSLMFEYGTSPDMLFATSVAQPDSITDNGTYNISGMLTGLFSNTQYFFRLRGETANGVYYSNIQSFYSAVPGTGLFATVASEVNHTTAKLNGKVSNFPVSAQLSFEYGTTPAFGNEIISDLGTINDTLVHRFSATVTGLSDNTIYYYRVKATTQNASSYSNVRKVFTGTPEVPNWDFQIWEHDTVAIPMFWNIPNDSVIRVSGHTGNYALKLPPDGFAILGIVNDNGPGPKFGGGCPFAARPDSITFYLNYFIEPGDTAAMLVNLRAGDSIVVNDFNIITGNSSGNFQRKSFVLNYLSELMPDTVLLGFVSFNPSQDPPQPGSPNNYIILDDIAFIPNTPIECNPDFESWFDFPYEHPPGWYTIHTVGIDPNDIPGSQSVVKAINNPPDDYAVELRCIDAGYGFIFNPDLSNIPNKDLSLSNIVGFPVSRRYEYANGYIKFLPVDNDSLQIIVNMFKNGLPIGVSNYYTADTINEFLPFDIKINYLDSTTIPDSASFCFRAISLQGVGLDVAYFDKISFDGLWSNLPDIVVSLNPVSENESVLIYPNPGSDKFILEASNLNAEKFSIQIFNLSGQMLYSEENIKAENGAFSKELNTSTFNSGIYLIKLTSNNIAKSIRWVKY